MKKKQEDYQSKFWKPLSNEDVIISKSIFHNYGFDKHIHEDFAIGVIEKGSINAFVDGSTRKIDKSSIMTINPDTAHSNLPFENSSYSQSAIYLNPSFIKTILKENFKSQQLYFKSGLLEDEKLANKFSTLALDYENNELSTIDYECQLVEIINQILLKNTLVKEQKNLTKYDIAVYKAKEFMQDNLALNLTLDDISKELDISKYHFLRLFKECTYFSPHTYLMLKRVEKAKQLLAKGDSLISIAFSCGFNDQSHLNRRFKEFVGLTPGEYQKFFI
jgi:AraC-like DNA-binding protein